jgi:hypothetical protein
MRRSEGELEVRNEEEIDVDMSAAQFLFTR